MKRVSVSGGLVTVVSDRDYARVRRIRWSATSHDPPRVWNTRVGLLHRFILGAKRGQEVDHRNGDPFDNRRCNLRFATRAENMRNRRANRLYRSTPFKGVTHDRKYFRARISVNGRSVSLGCFPNAVAAARAYDVAAKRLHGAFARPNGVPA